MPRKKVVIFSIVAAIGLIAGVGIFRYLNPNPGFTYFAPSYLPPGVSVTAKRILITNGDTSIEQNFRTEDWVYEIDERRATSPIDSAQQDYDPGSVQPTCDLRTSPAGQQYRLCHWVDYGRINVQEIILVKGGTMIESTIPTAIGRSIATEQIDKYVDSFRAKTTLGIPVVRSNF